MHQRNFVAIPFDPYCVDRIACGFLFSMNPNSDVAPEPFPALLKEQEGRRPGVPSAPFLHLSAYLVMPRTST